MKCAEAKWPEIEWLWPCLRNNYTIKCSNTYRQIDTLLGMFLWECLWYTIGGEKNWSLWKPRTFHSYRVLSLLLSFLLLDNSLQYFFFCFLTHGRNMPVYSVNCGRMSHTWRRQRIKKDIQANTHIQPVKAHINVGDREKRVMNCERISKTSTEGMILISMFYLEETHCPTCAFQITTTVMIL